MEKAHLITSWDDVPVVMDLVFASRILGFTIDTLRMYARKDKFPAFKGSDGDWRVEKDDLKKWIAGRKNNAMQQTTQPPHQGGERR